VNCSKAVVERCDSALQTGNFLMTSHDVFFSVLTSLQGIAQKQTAVLWIVHLEMSIDSL